MAAREEEKEGGGREEANPVFVYMQPYRQGKGENQLLSSQVPISRRQGKNIKRALGVESIFLPSISAHVIF